MDGVAILVPVLGRPQNVMPLVLSIRASTPTEHGVVFIADRDDLHEHSAVQASGAELVRYDGSYAEKINTGVRLTSEPLVFLGADDLHFQPGWLENAAARIADGAEVVGVNDLIPRRPGREGHATHFLMTREYALRPTIDGGRGPLHEGYSHSFVDDELIATATARGVYAYAEDAHVEHRHPMVKTAADDDTYRKGREHFDDDKRLFKHRRKLWA